jgi:hypothetical protein
MAAVLAVNLVVAATTVITAAVTAVAVVADVWLCQQSTVRAISCIIANTGQTRSTDCVSMSITCSTICIHLLSMVIVVRHLCALSHVPVESAVSLSNGSNTEQT